MYCKHCGKQIDDNSQFCKFCGKKLVETQNINIEFTKPKVIENIQSYFRKLLNKYRSLCNDPRQNEEFPFNSLIIAALFMAFFGFIITFGIVANVLRDSWRTIPSYEEISVWSGVLVAIIVFIWFVSHHLVSNKKSDKH